jgi:hypothetical protein
MSIEIKDVLTNPETKQVTLTIKNEGIIILQEAMKFYDDNKKGDVDDPKKLKIRKELREGLHQSWKSMNPS